MFQNQAILFFSFFHFLVKGILFPFTNFLPQGVKFTDFMEMGGFQGKRAISDQMNGAVNYIKHQKKKIKEIEAKRDELKKLDDNNWNRFEKSRGQTPICSFKISSFGGGLEIVITTSGFNGFPLSRILKVVVEQGLDVISCSSSSVNEKSIHTVQMEVRL